MPNVSIAAVRGALRERDSGAVNSYESKRQDGIMQLVSQKPCSKCKIEKSLSCFGPKKNSKDGLNSICRACIAAYVRAYMIQYRKNNPEKIRRIERTKRTRYRHRALEAIAGRPRPLICEICGEGGQINFDHSHLTLKFRGWLCNGCNLILGRVKDNETTLRKLADYLERSNAS